MEKIGVLTGGGDCPGLNAVIRAVVRRSIQNGREVIGIRNGWRGLLEEEWVDLGLDAVSGILPQGGTILRTSRTNPLREPDGIRRILSNRKKIGMGVLIAIGGDDTLGVAHKLCEEGLGVVGVPKTIDNDLVGTDFTFGFDTAVAIATDAIDRLHTTAMSHNRVMVVEVMGRYTGWIATFAGLAGGADGILVPEVPTSIDKICSLIRRRHERGKFFSIIVVAEGVEIEGLDASPSDRKKRDPFGHIRLGGVGNILAAEIEKRTGYESRVTVLGHIQRGGSPTAFDRILATRYGILAADLAHRGETGKMVALRGGKVVAVDLARAEAGLKKVDLETYRMAEVFFG